MDQGATKSRFLTAFKKFIQCHLVSVATLQYTCYPLEYSVLNGLAPAQNCGDVTSRISHDYQTNLQLVTYDTRYNCDVGDV